MSHVLDLADSSQAVWRLSKFSGFLHYDVVLHSFSRGFLGGLPSLIIGMYSGTRQLG